MIQIEGKKSKLSQNSVHYPVWRCRRNAIGIADTASLKMSDNLLNQRQLNMWRIRHTYFLTPLTCCKCNGFVREYRETNLTILSNYLNTVCPGAVMTHKAPRATTRQTVLEAECRRHGILTAVQTSTVCMVAGNMYNWSEYFLQQVNLVRCKVLEISSSGSITLNSPG